MDRQSCCRRSLCGGGDALGEVAFFTEIAQLEMVRTVSVCRILVVPRIAYNSIAAAFPIGARAILTNLLSRAQDVGPCHRPMKPYTYRWHIMQPEHASLWCPQRCPHVGRSPMLLHDTFCNCGGQHASDTGLLRVKSTSGAPSCCTPYR